MQSYSYNQPFESSHDADVAWDEIEFDTRDVMNCVRVTTSCYNPNNVTVFRFWLLPVFIVFNLIYSLAGNCISDPGHQKLHIYDVEHFLFYCNNGTDKSQ